MRRTRSGYPWLALMVIFLVRASALAQPQDASTSPPVPPPGRLIDVGGWRLHLNCTGEARASQPTVILEAGAGDFSVDWSLVQPAVARFARVCSYDRAGAGWSDLGPRPRTMHQVAWELRTLLEKAGERPPYVVVGHSAGGWLVRVYVAAYRSDVAGIVLCESGDERGVFGLKDDKRVPLVETATGQPLPAVNTSGPLRESEIPPRIRKLIEGQIAELLPHATAPPRDKLPADAQRMRAWSFSQVKHHIVNDNPFAGEELASLLAERTVKEHPLGDMPLVVLSRGGSEHAERQRNQASLAKMSRAGKQVIAARSGHHIPLDEPDLVVTAIRDVVAATRAVVRKDAATANPSPAESVTTRVDKLFEQWNRPDSPGCSVGISRHGAVVYERGYGMANLESGVPITPASVVPVASISKPFTAMSILLLAQRGRLSLDDEVRKHIPEWADHGGRLTIRHLLTHTGGLRDVFLLLELAAPRADVTDGTEALVNILARQRALNFTPGTEYQYNNGGYVVLASIVKRISGQSLRFFADANIFKPLGMTRTQFHDDPTTIVPNRVSGYYRDAGALHQAIYTDRRPSVGNAGLLTTARDLLLWLQNFADVRVGDPALLSAMQTPTVLMGGRTSSYGLGLEIGEYRRLKTVGHGGGGGGYGAYVIRYPDQGLGIAVLCNLEEINRALVGLTRGVADIYLADVFPTPSASSAIPAPPAVSLSDEQLASKVGLYLDPSSEALGDSVRIVVRDGTLTALVGAGDSVALTPVSANRFVVPGMAVALEFVPAASGRAQELHVITEGGTPEVLQRVTPFAPSSTELRTFAGKYTSSELDVTYVVAARDSGLVVQVPGRADVALQPIFRDGFQAAGLADIVKFLRNARGVVTGFTVHAGGVRSLRFDRVKR